RVPPQPPRGTGVDRSLAPVVFQVLHAPGEHLLQVLLLACPRTEVFAPGGPWIEPGKGRTEPVEGASTPPDAVGVPDLCARAPAGREVAPAAQPPGADLLPEGRPPCGEPLRARPQFAVPTAGRRLPAVIDDDRVVPRLGESEVDELVRLGEDRR